MATWLRPAGDSRVHPDSCVVMITSHASLPAPIDILTYIFDFNDSCDSYMFGFFKSTFGFLMGKQESGVR